MKEIMKSDPKYVVEVMGTVESTSFNSEVIEVYPSMIWEVEEYFDDLTEAEEQYDLLRQSHRYVRIVELHDK